MISQNPAERQLSDDKALLDEVRLVWLAPPEQFTYLREGFYWTTKARGPISRRFTGKGGRIVGYAEKLPNVRRSCYSRRVWWLKAHDRDLDPHGVYAQRPGVYPAEAVRPSSIRLGQPSESAP